MNTSNSTEGAQAAQPAEPSHGHPSSLRVVGRPDLLTAQKVEVSIILQAMLGTTVAAEYLANNEVGLDVSMRVLTQPALRRGRHDANGIPLR